MTHPTLKQFTVICAACHGREVLVVSTLDSDPENGTWGRVTLQCQTCHAEETVAEAP